MGHFEQEIPVKVYGNGVVKDAILIRDLKDPLNDVIVYPAQSDLPSGVASDTAAQKL